jgi:hypothetical protein
LARWGIFGKGMNGHPEFEYPLQLQEPVENPSPVWDAWAFQELERPAVRSQQDQTVTQAREALLRSVDQSFSGKEAKRYRENLDRFEQRARDQSVSTQEVAETYRQLDRLLIPGGFLPEKSRLMLAKQVLQHAAEPTNINNGQHKTCNVTTVEARLYTKYPSVAAKLVADIAVTGQYSASDGTKVAPPANSLKPDDESKWEDPLDGKRNYASHVFQVTAVNVHWQRQRVTPDGRLVPAGSIQYEQLPSRVSPDTGERLMDYSTNPPSELHNSKGEVLRQPYMRTRDVVSVSNQITGKNEKNVLMENRYKPDTGGNTLTFSSEKDLRDQLAELKKEGEFPIVFTVHTGNKPFSSDGGGSVWHVVTITDYDATADRASVDNEWGKRADHLGNRGVKIADLYKATLEPGFKIEQTLPGGKPREQIIIIG